MTPHRILYVEDDPDVRDTMSMLLSHEGYAVTAVPTAEAALEELRQSRYDLLLTDYQLPGANADWLIRTAIEQCSLGATQVIVLSGADDPEGIDGYRFLRKPIGQEALLAAFEAVMPEPREEPAPPRREQADLRLRLYVSGTSQVSRKARRNLALALQGVDEARVDVVVHDLAGADRGWEAPANEDRVVVVPTLVRVAPMPRVWIAGDLSQIEVVREAILPPAMALRSPSR
jgi:CheY-like chemotaxis protein